MAGTRMTIPFLFTNMRTRSVRKSIVVAAFSFKTTTLVKPVFENRHIVLFKYTYAIAYLPVSCFIILAASVPFLPTNSGHLDFFGVDDAAKSYNLNFNKTITNHVLLTYV